MKVNCFKPFFETHKPFLKVNDYFYFHIELCNKCSICLSVLGYGFSFGVWIYRV